MRFKNAYIPLNGAWSALRALVGPGRGAVEPRHGRPGDRARAARARPRVADRRVGARADRAAMAVVLRRAHAGREARGSARSAGR